MLQLIRKRAGLVLAGLIAALCPMLMAPTGGVSQVQSAFEVIGSRACTGGDTAGLCVTHTQSAHNKWAIALRPQGGAGNILGELITCAGNSTDTCFRVDTTAGTSFSIKGDGSVTGVPASVDSGALTWSFQTGTSTCTANGSNATVFLHKIGNVVIGYSTTGGSCTIASAQTQSTNNTPVPAGFRPSSGSSCGPGIATGASLTAGYVCVSAVGNFSVTTLGSAVTLLGLDNAETFTYTVD